MKQKELNRFRTEECFNDFNFDVVSPQLCDIEISILYIFKRTFFSM